MEWKPFPLISESDETVSLVIGSETNNATLSDSDSDSEDDDNKSSSDESDESNDDDDDNKPQSSVNSSSQSFAKVNSSDKDDVVDITSTSEPGIQKFIRI